MGVLSSAFNATFLNEPAWKWAVFIVALTLFLAAWGGVLRHM